MTASCLMEYISPMQQQHYTERSGRSQANSVGGQPAGLTPKSIGCMIWNKFSCNQSHLSSKKLPAYNNVELKEREAASDTEKEPPKYNEK